MNGTAAINANRAALSDWEDDGGARRSYEPPLRVEPAFMMAAPAKAVIVLVVEDDRQARELFRSTLRIAGYAVVAVEDGFDALTYLDTHRLLPPSFDLGLHILRHTFCSHLAMSGAPARAIQSWRDIRTSRRRSATCTLSPAALDAAVRLLDGPRRVADG